MRSQQLKLDGLLKLVWQWRWKRRIRLIKNHRNLSIGPPSTYYLDFTMSHAFESWLKPNRLCSSENLVCKFAINSAATFVQY